METPNSIPGLHKMTPVMAYQRGKADGIKEERDKARQDILSLLEKRYMDPTIERGSPTAEAILTLAREIAEEYRG